MKYKKGFFNHMHYNTFMYISISLTILLIFFNIVDIFDNSKLDIKNSKLTGNAIEDLSSENEDKIENNLEEEIYTEKSYLIYYILFGFLLFCIIVLSFIFLMPRFKDMT